MRRLLFESASFLLSHIISLLESDKERMPEWENQLQETVVTLNSLKYWCGMCGETHLPDLPPHPSNPCKNQEPR